MLKIKNIKTSSILILLLLLFALLQLGSNLVAYTYLNNNMKNIKTMRILDEELYTLNLTLNSMKNAQYTIYSELLDMAANPARTPDTSIQQASNLLNEAKNYFQQFLIIPGLSLRETKLVDDLTQAYKNQYLVLETQLGILKSKQSVSVMLQQLYAFKESRAEKRDIFQWYVKEYMKKIGDEYDKNELNAVESFQVFINTVIIIILLVLTIIVMLHFWLRNNLVRPLQKIIQHFSLIESGNLRHKLNLSASREINDVQHGVNKMQQGLIKTVKTVRDSAESIGIGTQEIASGNTDLSSRTEEQATALTQTAANMEQIAATVLQNAHSASEASLMINSTSAKVYEGESLMHELVQKMHTINASSRHVCDIISTIDAIAFQTNILALNAAVEAARAGEQGRGFSVVAGEVRNLAQRCATSAKEINQLITSATVTVEEGVSLAEKAGQSMNQIVSAIKKVAPVMESISMASDEQSRGVEQIRQALGQMDEVTQQNAALVEQVATNSGNVESQSVQLMQAVSVFQFDERPVEQPVISRLSPLLPAKNKPQLIEENWSSF